MSAVVAGGAVTASGRTRVTTRALTSVASAITAEVLDVDAGHVRIDLDDHDGRLGVTVRTPVGIPSLRALAEGAAEDTLLARSGRLRSTLEDRIPGMTGYTVSRVTVHLTGALIRPMRRVA